MRAKAGQSKVILGSDRVSDSVGASFSKKGIKVEGVARDVNSEGMDAVDAISATKVRKAILENRTEDARAALDPRIGEVLTRPENINRMNKRAAVVAEKKQKEAGVTTLVNAEFGNLTKLAVSKGIRGAEEKPISRLVGSVTKSDDPQVLASIARIKDLRENEKAKIKKDYDHRLSQMARKNPISMASGFVPNFRRGQPIDYDSVATLLGDKQFVDAHGGSLRQASKALNINSNTLSNVAKNTSPSGSAALEALGSRRYGKLKENIQSIGAEGTKKRGMGSSFPAVAGNTFEEQFKTYLNPTASAGSNPAIDWKSIPTAAKKRKAIKMESGYSVGDTIWMMGRSRKDGTSGHGHSYMADKIARFEETIQKRAQSLLKSKRKGKGKKNRQTAPKSIHLGDHNIAEILGFDQPDPRQDGLKPAKLSKKGSSILKDLGIVGGSGLSGTKPGSKAPSPEAAPLRAIAHAFPRSTISLGYQKDYIHFSPETTGGHDVRGEAGKKWKEAKKKKGKAAGYLPNFAEEKLTQNLGGIKDAVAREESRGHKAEILYSQRLQSPVVVNKKQVQKYGRNADQIIREDHVERGQGGSKANLMKTGSGKESYSGGYVPNFQGDGHVPNFMGGVFGGMGIGMLGFIAQFDTLKRVLDPAERALQETARALGKFQAAMDKADRELEEITRQLDDIQAGKGPKIKKDEKRPGFFTSDDKNTQDIITKLDKENKLVRGADEADFDYEARAQSQVTGARREQLEQGQVDVSRERATAVTGVDRSQQEHQALEEKQKSAEEFKGKIAAGAMAIGVASSVFAGMIKDETSRTKKALEALGGAAQMSATAMFMIPGPIGLLIGGVAGAYMAMSGISHAISDIGPKLGKSAELHKEAMQKLTDGLQKYAAAYQKRESALENPEMEASTISRLNRQMADAMMDVPDAYRTQVQSANSLSEMQDKMADALAAKTRLVQQTDFAAKFGKRLDDSKGMGFGVGKFIENVTPNWALPVTRSLGVTGKQAYDPKSSSGQMALERAAKDLLSSMEDVDIEKIAKMPGVTKDNSANQIIPMMLDFKTTAEELAIALRAAKTNGDAAKQMFWKVFQLARRGSELATSEKNINAVRSEQAVVNDRMNESMKQSVSAYNNAREAYHQFLRLIGKKMTFAKEIVSARQGAERDVGYKGFELNLKRMSPFMSKGQLGRSKDELAMAKLIDGYNRGINKILTPVANNIAGIMAREVGTLKASATAAKVRPAGGRGGYKKIAAQDKIDAAMLLQKMLSNMEIK